MNHHETNSSNIACSQNQPAEAPLEVPLAVTPLVAGRRDASCVAGCEVSWCGVKSQVGEIKQHLKHKECHANIISEGIYINFIYLFPYVWLQFDANVNNDMRYPNNITQTV